MKNIITKISALTLAVLILIGINSCKKEYDTPPIPNIPVGDVLTVSDLIGMSTETPYKFTEDKSVYAVVSLGGTNGNIYKEAYMQDATGGIKLSLLSAGGLKAGDSVRIYLKGARLWEDHRQVVLDSLHITKNVIKLSAGNTLEPISVSISDIKTGAYKGMLVKIENVQFIYSELGETWADAVTQSTTNRNLEDCDGGDLIVRTSGYANFANAPLPQGNGSLVAVASVYGTSSYETHQVYVRTMEEVQMDGDRCGSGGGSQIDPVNSVDEGFDAAVNYEDISIEGWTSITVDGDRAWQGKEFESDKYAQATGYNSTATSIETWLITPPVTNIGDKVLSLKTAKAYWTHTSGDPLTILISTDFVGDNFTTATWEELSVTIANSNSSDNAWIASGEVDLSAYSGNAAIAFKYVGSGTESTSFRLDDIKIDVPGGGGGGGGVTPVDAIDEQFNSATNYTDIDLEGWTNISVEGDRHWQGKEYNTDKYAQATGHNSGLAAMETWLITPPVTNIGSKTLSLKTAKAYWAHSGGNPLTVLVSEDFDGENFETATWTELSLTLAIESDDDNAWIESGEVSLSAFSGNAAIAFKYVGSDTESTSFRLDDIKIGTDGGGGGGITPVDAINENFDNAVEYEDISFTGWTNVNVIGDRKWQGKFYEADKYAQATGYNSGLDAMETWLITPPITNIETKSLSLLTAKAYWAHPGSHPLTVLVSEDFNGENFESANWTEIDITIAQESDTDHAWIDSGLYSLSSFNGTAAIAFKYEGSQTETTSIRLDNIVVQ